MSYLGWTAVGVLAAFGLAAILTIGLPFLVLAAALAAFLAWRGVTGRGATGLALGGAAVAGYLAWLNRGGPGDVCTSAGASTSCTTEASPWPFIVVAALLAAGSIVWFAWLGRRQPLGE